MNNHRIKIKADSPDPCKLEFNIDGEMFPIRSFDLNFHIENFSTLTLDMYPAHLEIDIEANVKIGECKIPDDIAKQMYEKLKEKFDG